MVVTQLSGPSNGTCNGFINTRRSDVSLPLHRLVSVATLNKKKNNDGLPDFCVFATATAMFQVR